MTTIRKDEVNAWLAENVMGWFVGSDHYFDKYKAQVAAKKDSGLDEWVWNPQENIADAMMLDAKMLELGYWFDYGRSLKFHFGTYRKDDIGHPSGQQTSLEKAICYAILKAYGVEVSE